MRLRSWTATTAEIRTAWVTASLCMAVTITSFLWPQTKPEFGSKPDITPAKRSAAALKQPVPKAPSTPTKPVAQPKQISKTVEKLKPTPKPKKEVKAVASKTVTATSLASGYYVQLGAFKDQKRAQTLAKKLTPAWKTHIASRPNGMIAVWVGPYTTSKEATRYREKIASRTKLKGFVVKH